jgi:hypothetical protein
MTANSSSDKTLTIAASNSGSGSGIISLSADSLSLTGAAAFGSAATFNAGLLTKAGSSSGFVRFYEQSGNGSNYIGLVAPNSVSSDVSFTLPSADGSNGQVLQTNGSGVLSFVDNGSGGSTAADDLTAGDAAVTLTTTSGNITIDAQGANTDIIFKGTQSSSDITMLTLDGSSGGAATFNTNITTGLDVTVGRYMYFGNQYNAKIDVNDVSGTDTAGKSLTMLSGAGTGTGAGGDIIFQVANAGGSSGSSVNSHATALTISDDKSATFAGEVVISAGNLDIGGTNVTATAAELNLLDGDTSATSTTLVDADRIIVNDAGTMKQVALSDLKTYTGSGGSASKPGYNAPS